MTTATSLNKKNKYGLLPVLLKRNRGYMLLWFCICLGVMPLSYWMTATKALESKALYASPFYGQGGLYTLTSMALMAILWPIASAVCCLVQFSYMQNRRAVDLYHSLPIRRARLLMSNCAAAFLTIAIPFAVNYLLTLAMAAFFSPQIHELLSRSPEIYGYSSYLMPHSAFEPFAALLDLFSWLVGSAGIIGLGAVIAVLVGSTFDTLVFGIIICLAPISLYIVNWLVSGELLYGYCYVDHSQWIMALSPLTFNWEFMVNTFLGADTLTTHTRIAATILWILIDALLLYFAGRLYTTRPSERAESHSRQGVLPLVIRGICSMVVCPIVGLIYAQTFGTRTNPVMGIVGTAVSSVILFLIMETVLNRGVKGIAKSFPLCALVTVMVCGYMFAMSGDGFGYVHYIPDIDNVATVTIGYRGRFENVNHYLVSTERMSDDFEAVPEKGLAGSGPVYWYSIADKTSFTGSEGIAAVQKLHKAILNTYDEYHGNYPENGKIDGDKWFEIEYVLKNGRIVKRYYSGSRSPEWLEAERELALCSEMELKNNPLFVVPAERFTSVLVESADGFKSGTISAPDKKQLLADALKADMQADTSETYWSETKQIAAILHFSMPDYQGGHVRAPGDFYEEFSVLVPYEYKNTIQSLEKLGFGDVLKAKTKATSGMLISAGRHVMLFNSADLLVSDCQMESVREGELKNFREYWDTDFGVYELDDETQIEELQKIAKPYAIQRDGDSTELLIAWFWNDETVGCPQLVRLSDMEAHGMEKLAGEIRALLEKTY